MKTENIYCPKCASKQQGNDFCSKCGNQLIVEEQKKVQVKTQLTKEKKLDTSKYNDDSNTKYILQVFIFIVLTSSLNFFPKLMLDECNMFNSELQYQCVYSNKAILNYCLVIILIFSKQVSKGFVVVENPKFNKIINTIFWIMILVFLAVNTINFVKINF